MIHFDLLSSYFKGRCTPEEREQVEAYLQGTDHETLDVFLNMVWADAQAMPGVRVIPPRLVLPGVPARGWRWYGVRAAAMAGILLTAATGWFALRHQLPLQAGLVQTAWHEVNNRKSGIQSVRMVDGTQIWLNKNAVIRYRDDYNLGSRDIELTGEAYFEVARLPEKPFHVHAGSTVTTALGTAFNICAYTMQDTAIRISLLEGKVSVVANHGAMKTTRLLTRGMSVRYEDAVLEVPVRNASIDNVLAWRDNKLCFDSCSLKDVCRRLSYQFNVPVVLDGVRGTQLVSGVFKGTDDVKSIIDDITFIHHLHVSYDSRRGYRIYL